MTRDDIIKLAREAGLKQRLNNPDEWFMWTHELAHFVALVSDCAAAKEREACAALCNDIVQEEEGKPDRDYSREATAEELGILIRARGQQ